jgi:hypothetical protein
MDDKKITSKYSFRFEIQYRENLSSYHKNNVCKVTSTKKYNDESATCNSIIKTNTSIYHDLLFVRFLFKYDWYASDWRYALSSSR